MQNSVYPFSYVTEELTYSVPGLDSVISQVKATSASHIE